jgi:hypothetical protein
MKTLSFLKKLLGTRERDAHNSRNCSKARNTNLLNKTKRVGLYLVSILMYYVTCDLHPTGYIQY